MISHESPDRWSVTTSQGEVGLFDLSTEGLRAYLAGIIHAGKPLWSEAAIDRVLTLDVGDSTKPPHGVYR